MKANVNKTPLEMIDDAAASYAIACKRLGDAMGERQAELDAVTARHTKAIKATLATAQVARATLFDLVDEHPSAFSKPKTRILHGLKVGYEKARGKLSWPKGEAAKVIERIKKQIPDLVEVVIKTEEKPVKKALGNLTADVLKKLGITVQDAGDAVVIRPIDSDMDKLVKELLEGADGEDEA